jgi:hypothetical protein
MTLNASGNLGIGTTSPGAKLQVTAGATGVQSLFSHSSGTPTIAVGATTTTYNTQIGYNVTSEYGYIQATAAAGVYDDIAINPLGGNLLVGTTSQLYPASAARLNVDSGTNGTATFKTSGGSVQATLYSFNSATTGDNAFISFGTEATWTSRGGITYNRAGGLVAYNVTSDYRAKDISGPVTGSGAVIDSVPVYMGKMKGATQERPMFIAHEVPAYAHTGEKDAVDAEGNPVFQQMDASALIPVMWAEIQSLRARLAAANI